MTDVMLTGANGQLGWEIVRRSAGGTPPLVAFDRAGLDITDRDTVATVVAAYRPQVIVNAAAYTAVDRAESERDAAFAVNEAGARHLAEAAQRHGAILIHISTDYVFDGSADRPYTEMHPTAPLGVYGASKLAGEEAVRAACERHVILRTSWVYGVHGRNFVKTMLRLGGERDALSVVDDQTGCPTEAGALADVCLAIALTAMAGMKGWGTFHCAGRGATTWCGFAREIFRLSEPYTGRSPMVHAITTAEYPTPARRPANSVLDCAKLAQVWNVRPGDWQPALAGMIDEMHGAGLAARLAAETHG